MNAVEVRNLNYIYPDGIQALSGVDFSVKENESIGIVGPNGAGKTTLFLAICGLVEAKGEIKILSQRLTKKNVKELRKNIGFVFQNPDDQLFMPTVFEDIAFGLLNKGLDQKIIKEKIKIILSKFNLSGYENRHSHHLSFGEKKLISLSSVLVMEPEILLLDEPTSNLDRRERRQIKKYLGAIEKTKIIAGHDFELIDSLCSRVIVINKGKTVYSGDEKILKKESLLEELGF